MTLIDTHEWVSTIDIHKWISLIISDHTIWTNPNPSSLCKDMIRCVMIWRNEMTNNDIHPMNSSSNYYSLLPIYHHSLTSRSIAMCSISNGHFISSFGYVYSSSATSKHSQCPHDEHPAFDGWRWDHTSCQHPLSTHTIDTSTIKTPYQHILSTSDPCSHDEHPAFDGWRWHHTSCQHTCQHPILTHPINTPQ